MSNEISECLFADNVALICTSRSDVVIATRVFEKVTAEFGLILTIPKTKLLIAGDGYNVAGYIVLYVAPLELV